MSKLTTGRLLELRLSADMATPGSWVWEEGGDLISTATENGEVVLTTSNTRARVSVASGDKEYIATFDPPTVLALLDEIEDLYRDRDAVLDILGREEMDTETKLEGVRLILNTKGGDSP